MIHVAMAQQNVPIIPPPLGKPMDNNPLVPCNQQGDPLNDLFDELQASIEATRDRIENEGNQLGKADLRRAKHRRLLMQSYYFFDRWCQFECVMILVPTP